MSDPTPPPPPETSKSTYVIGCKLPNGLICEMGKFGDEDYVQVHLKGANDQFAVHGFGITANVNANFWDRWVKKNQRLEFMKKGTFVFAAKSVADAEAMAREFALVKTGLEALDPLKKIVDPRTGETILEVDSNHFSQAKREVAQVTAKRA